MVGRITNLQSLTGGLQKLQMYFLAPGAELFPNPYTFLVDICVKERLKLDMIKNIARKIVFPAIVGVGLEKIFSALCKNNKLILVYHGVVERPQHQISVGPISTAQFRQHLAYFSRNFNVVSMAEIFKMYRENYSPKRKTIAITFDDGYENNYINAYPLLKQYNFPATMFVISGCVENDNMVTWYDYIDFVKQEIDVSKLKLSENVSNVSGLKNYIKTLNITDRNKLFADIEKQVGFNSRLNKVSREHWKLMNRQQLQDLVNSELIEVGAHTHNHPNLGEIALQDAEYEVTKSKRVLEDAIQKNVSSIAFPDGSYNDAVKKICVKAGYTNLLAVNYRSPSDVADKTILPRYCISSTTTFESNMIQVNRNFNGSGF